MAGAIGGMIGPALFVVTFTIEGGLRPGYGAREMFVSELSLGPRGWIQIANFIITGVLLLLFARGVAAEFRDGTHREPVRYGSRLSAADFWRRVHS